MHLGGIIDYLRHFIEPKLSILDVQEQGLNYELSFRCIHEHLGQIPLILGLSLIVFIYINMS